MITEVAQLVWLDFVFLGIVEIDAALAGTGTPRTLHHLFLAQKIGGLNGVRLVGRPENHPVAQIQRQHLRLVVAERWNQ